MQKVQTIGKVSICNNTLTSKQAIADTGCTYHYLTIDALQHCTEAIENDGVSISLPNGNTMTSALSAELPYNTFSSTARQATLFPTITENLISVGQLCDDNCMAMFSPTKMKIFKIDQEITDVFNKKREFLLGLHNKHTRMWEVELQDNIIFHQPQQKHKNQQKINNVYKKKQNKRHF